MWAQHSSGTFSQLDLRESVKPLDAIPRLAVAWEPSGTLAFAADRPMKWEIPYDDVYVPRSDTSQSPRP
jgi:WD repeat-containing protein 24